MATPHLEALFQSILLHQSFLARQPGGRRLMVKSGRFARLEGHGWDLTEAVLPNSNWTDGDFLASKFDRADLFCADLTRANMRRASFEQTDLRGAVALDTVFAEANLRRADLRPGKTIYWSAGGSTARLRPVNFDNANLQAADLREAVLEKASLRSSNMRGAHADFANLAGADLSGADLTGASLKSVNLLGANVGGACFKNADLSHANLRNVDLTRADLTGAMLHHTMMRRSDEALPDAVAAALAGHSLWINSGGREGARLDLSGADLTKINLEGSDLRAAVFRGATLIGADLSHCDMTMADLAEADLTHATLNHAILTGANLGHARLQGARLRGAELGHIKIRDAHGRDTGRRAPTIVAGTDFDMADLRGARFHDTDPAGARFLGARLEGCDLNPSLALEPSLR